MLTRDDFSPDRHFTDAAVGAIVALIRVVELYDPAVAHRAALRAIVAERLMNELSDVPCTSERAEIIAASALADVDLAVSRPRDPEAADEPTRSLLGATLIGRLPGLRNVSTAISRHRERWEDAQDDLPLASRIIAATDCLVGNPAAGFVPTWDHALRRIHRNAGTTLDPDVVDALARAAISDIEAPPIPSAAIHDLLSKVASNESEPGTETATTIRTAVAAAGETTQLMALFASTALRTTSAAEVLIYRFDETQLGELPTARASDGQRPAVDHGRLEILRDFSIQAELRAGTSIVPTIDDGHGNALIDPANDVPVNDVIVPIMSADQPWGVLVASRRLDEPAFDAHDLSVLRHVASEAAVAVASTTHWAEIENMALRDQLTGLSNRHALYRVLDDIFELPALERLDTALIMCDVDGLKTVNDTQGHQAGDRLLADAAAALRGAIRDPERTTVCRIGGDEFCMVINGGALLTAHEVSDMIERLFARSAGSGPPRSISCGIAFVNEEIDSRSALLRAADENQYQTKRARKAQREAELEQLSSGAAEPVERRAIRD